MAQQGDGNEFLRALRQTPEDVFNDVSVDMFVNSRLSPFAARRALSLIHKSVEYLKNKPDAKEVNDVLGLEETDARAGTQIPGVYEYEVGSFGTEAIMTFCRERLEEGTDSVN